MSTRARVFRYQPAAVLPALATCAALALATTAAADVASEAVLATAKADEPPLGQERRRR